MSNSALNLRRTTPPHTCASRSTTRARPARRHAVIHARERIGSLLSRRQSHGTTRRPHKVWGPQTNDLVLKLRKRRISKCGSNFRQDVSGTVLHSGYPALAPDVTTV